MIANVNRGVAKFLRGLRRKKSERRAESNLECSLHEFVAHDQLEPDFGARFETIRRRHDRAVVPPTLPVESGSHREAIGSVAGWSLGGETPRSQISRRRKMKDPHSRQSAARLSADTKTAVVRYQVRDVDRAVGFYTQHLGFTLSQRPGPVLAIVARGDLHLLLSGPEASGSRAMPDGRRQEPGGWNRIV